MNRPFFNTTHLPGWMHRLPQWVSRFIFLVMIAISPVGWPVLFLIDEMSRIWPSYKAEVKVLWHGFIGRWV